MLPTPLLRFEIDGGRLEPRYLDARHVPLARLLLERYRALAGRRRRELEESLRESRDLRAYPPRVVDGLQSVIREHVVFRIDSAVPPAMARETLFTRAARERDVPRGEVVALAARELGVEAVDLERSLFADLARERRLEVQSSLPGAGELISRYNFRLLQGLLLHSERVRIELDDAVRPVYRLAKLNGLLVELKREPGRDEGEAPLELEVTGPLSLLKKTRRYGYALARFLPACCLARRYRLEADIVLRGCAARLAVSQEDRVLTPHRLPRWFDSRVEQRFYRDFLRLDSRWDISRETVLLRAGTSIFIPDFTFRHRSEPRPPVHLEIMGFWTRDYLARKLLLLGSAAASRMVFCVDARLSCDLEPTAAHSIVFKGRVPADRVLRAIERLGDAGPT